jgi:Domain of unknown function (DUF2017)
VKVSGRHARLRLVLTAPEIDLFDDLLGDLTTVYEDDDPADEVVRRLNPSAYPHDVEADAEYRGLTESGLRDDRLARLAACRAELAGGGPIALGDPDTGTRWIQVLNDLRLTLGTRLGVTEDGQPAAGESGDSDESDESGESNRDRWLVYHWLTAVQEHVVQALMR